MKKNRLIPVLLLKNGWLVQSKGFSRYQNLGNPITAVKRMSEWASDELIYIDISKDDLYDTRRNDQGYQNKQSFLEIIEDVSKVTFMPITVGGKIRTLSDIEDRLLRGADKITINTISIENHEFIKLAAKEFGSQCIVISIDVKKETDEHIVYKQGGTIKTNFKVEPYSKIVEDFGAGEILINSIDRDGMRNGYDIELLDKVCTNVAIPVIGLGGVGEWINLKEAFENTDVDAVAAANIFHYSDQSVFLAKKYLFESGLNVRQPDLITI
jgi:imidazole glycerol-phosphate synthase subunit HisF